MADEQPRSSGATEDPRDTDAIPRTLTAVAGHLLTLDFVVHFILGIVSIALGTWYALSRPGIAVLVVAVSIAGYVLVHAWRHMSEHPRRDRAYRRRQRERANS